MLRPACSYFPHFSRNDGSYIHRFFRQNIRKQAANIQWNSGGMATRSDVIQKENQDGSSFQGEVLSLPMLGQPLIIKEITPSLKAQLLINFIKIPLLSCHLFAILTSLSFSQGERVP